MNQVFSVQPKMKMGNLPFWYHESKSKIKVKGYDYANNTLFLESNAVKVSIYPDDKEDGWFVKYQIRHPDDLNTDNCVFMFTEDLKTAFGLSDIRDYRGQWTVNAYGGDAACPGRYIRYGDYLNIPGPGTGDDRDRTLNLSILLDDNIKDFLELVID